MHFLNILHVDQDSLAAPQRSNWVYFSTGPWVVEMGWRWTNDHRTNDSISWRKYVFTCHNSSSMVLSWFDQLFGEDAISHGTLGTLPITNKASYPKTPQSLEGCRPMSRLFDHSKTSYRILKHQGPLFTLIIGISFGCFIWQKKWITDWTWCACPNMMP